MSILGIRKNKDNRNKVPFFKKKAVKIFLVFFSFVLIFGISFFAYLYASGSKIFDNGSGFTPFFKMIKGEQSDILKEERINIVVIGRGGDNHPGGLLTDSLMIVSVNTKTNQVAMINIPRDLLVPIKGHGQAKINEAYADGYNDYLAKNCKGKNTSSNCRNEAFSAGANLTRQTISEVFGIPIQYYISADFTGFEKLIDSLGGIDVYVDKAIYDPLYPDKDMKGYKPFSVKVGQQHFDGATALKYARSRETTSDFDRSRRQQQILLATKDKALKSGILTNPKELVNIINIIGDHLRTDLDAAELKALAEKAKNIDKNNIINQILSTDSNGPLVSDSSTGTYYIRTRTGNFNELQKIAKNIFNSETPESAKIEVLNGSKTPGSGSKLAALIEEEGYNVVNIATNKTIVANTVIYDYSNGKMKNTIQFLKDGLNASVIQKNDPAKSVDISIIIGNDYRGFNIKSN